MFVATLYTHLAAFHIPFMQLLQDKGYEVYAAASSAEGRREELEAVGVKCWEIPFARSPYSLTNLTAYRQLRALLETHCFDLVHVHTPVAAFLARYLAKATRQGPVLYTAHGFHFYRGAPIRHWLVYYPAEGLAARWTDGLIVMNGEDYVNAQRLGFNPGENLFWVHGVGVDLDRFSSVDLSMSIRKELGLGTEDVVVTCVTEFTPTKNHALLLKAWEKLAQRTTNAHLLLVGDGILRPGLQQQVEKKALPRVHFVGFRRDVPQILKETDIFVLASRREGLPRCIMEAMAAGKPVVATDVRGSRELVENGKTGLLIELGDVEGLVSALEKLINDAELRLAMGREGLERIKDYSLQRVLSEMDFVYSRYLR